MKMADYSSRFAYVLLIWLLFNFVKTAESNCTCNFVPDVIDNCPAGTAAYTNHEECLCTCGQTTEKQMGRREDSHIPKLLTSNEIISRRSYALASRTSYRVIVTNYAHFDINVFLFQEPAVYKGRPEVFSNSLGTVHLKAKTSARTDQASFTLEEQYRAGVQKQVKPPEVGVVQTSKVSSVGINLNTVSQQYPDQTVMGIDEGRRPYLENPTYSSCVQRGAFRIQTPIFQSGEGPYNVGMASVVEGYFVMSNYITAKPNSNIDVRPLMKFYVSTGAYTLGTVMDFTTSSKDSALCDATTGQVTFNVAFNSDGTWSVE